MKNIADINYHDTKKNEEIKQNDIGKNKDKKEFIQTIRMFRKKEDDILALYILEFFKFIGCIVCDCVVNRKIINGNLAGKNDGSFLQEKYDIDIILNLNETFDKDNYPEICKLIKEGKRRVEFLSIDNQCFLDEITVNKKESSILLKVIELVWGMGERKGDIGFLSRAYKVTQLFWYLYVKANFKYIQEYFPNREEASEARTSAYNEILNSYKSCYNCLVSSKYFNENSAPYYKYAIILLEHKLNAMKLLVGKQAIFHTEGMLDQVEKLRKIRPDFIRLAYLAGNICIKDTRYLGAVSRYLRIAIDLMKESYGEIRALDFLYYQLGRYYEKSIGNMQEAYINYEKSISINPLYYRALYKRVCREDRENKPENAIEYAKPLLKILVNDHECNTLMPKQQIYAFKSLGFYGKLMFEVEKYDVAERYFQKALEISEIKSVFYDYFPGKKEVFLNVQEQGMPRNQIEIERNRCLSMYLD